MEKLISTNANRLLALLVLLLFSSWLHADSAVQLETDEKLFVLDVENMT